MCATQTPRSPGALHRRPTAHDCPRDSVTGASAACATRCATTSPGDGPQKRRAFTCHLPLITSDVDGACVFSQKGFGRWILSCSRLLSMPTSDEDVRSCIVRSKTPCTWKPVRIARHHQVRRASLLPRPRLEPFAGAWIGKLSGSSGRASGPVGPSRGCERRPEPRGRPGWPCATGGSSWTPPSIAM